MLEEVIKACHKRNIDFIARFDFSKADDEVYLNRLQWFVRNKKGEPQIIGAKRPGGWPLLYSTCINGGYRSNETAIPILDEALTRYDIDAVFLNTPHYIECFCRACRVKYLETYGKELPEEPVSFEKDWPDLCFRDNIQKLHSCIKTMKKDIPLILYYYTSHPEYSAEEADLLCTESQDVLSMGQGRIPKFFQPAINTMLGRTIENIPNPFVIIHSCPGMDWRHTGLPEAEYIYWMSQVPANGGLIWHSLTGIPDTIIDKRILDAVCNINHMVKKVEDHMNGMDSAAETLLFWNGSVFAEGWAAALGDKQIPFNILVHNQAALERLRKYKIVIIPLDWDCTSSFADCIKKYIAEGGKVNITVRELTVWESLLVTIK